MEIATALMIGLLGSLHCLGMCGPIALALPIGNASFIARLGYVLTYNAGRIVTYGIIGAFAGLIGLGFSIAGEQQILSILCGVLIIFIALFSMLYSRIKISGLFYRLVNFIKESFKKLLQNKSFVSMFMLGLINGLLPCGLVYIALAGATATGHPLTGIFFMIFFGLGTVPAMASIGLIKNILTLTMRARIKKIIPVMSVIVGMLLILRGLNLGVPYVSPKSETTNCEIKCCH